MEEIGRRLRAAREARELTLQVVEDETKIRRKYIEALESGRVADLPGDAYVKGFLRTYGNYLGLDGTALVEEYKQSAQGGPDE
ncbi:MAG TPA: helix-turn-helix transcriptional regulator, partial [Symbiobacteriaceae bacterium]|nr:helix-turn-helix transcriptional regulator [Symbiobacteriaceae bacterium]